MFAYLLLAGVRAPTTQKRRSATRTWRYRDQQNCYCRQAASSRVQRKKVGCEFLDFEFFMSVSSLDWCCAFIKQVVPAAVGHANADSAVVYMVCTGDEEEVLFTRCC